MTGLLHDRLAATAAFHESRPAIVFGTTSITYKELERSSNQLARALKSAGCRPGDRVALLLPKSIEAVVAMFGSMKAGCINVPLDTTSPVSRVARMVESSGCRCVLAVDSTAPLLERIAQGTAAFGSAGVGWMDDGTHEESALETRFQWRDVAGLCFLPLEPATSASDAAHILFTSGSTGTPKGVVITHSNVTRFVDWAVTYFGICPGDRVSGHSPFHFDLSTFDIHGSVTAGATLYLVPPELSLLPHRITSFIRDSHLTQWFSVPSVLNQIAKLDLVERHDFPTLRRLLWCGEKFPTTGLMYWMRRLPHTNFFNLYGPTEATIASSCHHIPRCPSDERAEIPIGDACSGEGLMILDKRLRPAAPGEIGDLYITGAGLSPGYWRDPVRTAEVFVTSPNGSEAFRRIYKTGDLAMTGEDGRMYLVGREDSQIKSRGYRIELGEVEAAVHAQQGVLEAAVVAVDSAGFESTSICCAFVPCADGLTPIGLRKRLAEVLPGYMLPVRWLALERMPLNASGKVDRRWVKEQFRQAERSTLPATGLETAGAT